MRTEEELNEIKAEVVEMGKKLAELSDEELVVVVGGVGVEVSGDTESLKISGKTVPLPPARPKKEEDGGYAGPKPKVPGQVLG